MIDLLFDFNKPLQTSILIYLIIIGVLFYIKPRFMFDPKGNIKKFGTGSGRYRTVFPLWLILTTIAILVYYFVAMVAYRQNLKSLCQTIKKGKIDELKNLLEGQCPI